MKMKPSLLRLTAAGIIGLLTVVIFKFKSIDDLKFHDFLHVLIVLSIFGFKEIQEFLRYRKSIKNGVDSLKNNKTSFSNDLGNVNQLLVRNDLLWLENGKKMKQMTI